MHGGVFPLPQYVFMSCCSVQHRNAFTFNCVPICWAQPVNTRRIRLVSLLTAQEARSRKHSAGFGFVSVLRPLMIQMYPVPSSMAPCLPVHFHLPCFSFIFWIFLLSLIFISLYFLFLTYLYSLDYLSVHLIFLFFLILLYLSSSSPLSVQNLLFNDFSNFPSFSRCFLFLYFFLLPSRFLSPSFSFHIITFNRTTLPHVFLLSFSPLSPSSSSLPYFLGYVTTLSQLHKLQSVKFQRL